MNSQQRYCVEGFLSTGCSACLMALLNTVHPGRPCGHLCGMPALSWCHDEFVMVSVNVGSPESRDDDPDPVKQTSGKLPAAGMIVATANAVPPAICKRPAFLARTKGEGQGNKYSLFLK